MIAIDTRGILVSLFVRRHNDDLPGQSLRKFYGNLEFNPSIGQVRVIREKIREYGLPALQSVCVILGEY